MTKVKFENNTLTVEGHSNYDILGKDIVCSAISTATVFLINADNLSYKQNNALLRVNITNASKNNLRTYKEIIRQLSEQYPENVKVKE